MTMQETPEEALSAGEERDRLEGFQPLDDDAVQAILSAELEAAQSHTDEQVAEERRKAVDYYNGKPFGNEVEGQSQVMLTDVQDTVEWVMPSLMRMFFGGSRIVDYEPQFTDDPEAQAARVQGAEQATQYVNKVFLDQMDGFTTVYDLVKSAALEKNAPGVVMFEELMEPALEKYREITEAEFAQLLEDESFTPTASAQAGVMEEIGPDGQPIVSTLWDVEGRRLEPKRRVTVQAIPPEDFFISPRATVLDDDTPFCGYRTRMLGSDLIARGIPMTVVDDLPYDDTADFSEGKRSRHDQTTSGPDSSRNREDAASRPFWVYNVFIRIDRDGDGYSELRRYLFVDKNAPILLEEEEIPFNPMFDLNLIRMPHRYFGISLADLVMDLQLWRSTLVRQMMDHLYQVNHPMHEIVEANVETDDILTLRAGGKVRVTQAGSIVPIPVNEMGPQPFNMLEFTERIESRRSGVADFNMGLDASALNDSTVGGMSKMLVAAQAKTELMARLIAVGLKRMFTLLYRTVKMAPIRPQGVRLRGQWVPVDVSLWHDAMDVHVRVGLGIGQAQERAAAMNGLFNLQAQMMQMGMGGLLVTPDNLYQTAKEAAAAAEMELPERFFTDPEGRQPPPPPPDPQLVQIQQDAQIRTVELQLRREEMEANREKERALAAHRQAELESKERIELAKIQADRDKALLESRTDLEVAEARTSPQ